MKIIICPDKFKGTLTANEATAAINEGIKTFNPSIETLLMPMSDGGEGLVSLFAEKEEVETIKMVVHNPLFKPIETTFAYHPKEATAFIEMSKASGLELLRKEERNPCYTTSFGTGEMIKKAIETGAKKIILGIGGSATNDAGIGMAEALGYQFFDKQGNRLTPIGKNLIHIETIDSSEVNQTIFETVLIVACDVKNVLYGQNGAAFVYAAQKGANVDEIKILDSGLINMARVIRNHFNINLSNLEGAGAAGGMGAGAVAFLNGTITSGIDLIMNLYNFENHLSTTDLILTGEGKLDSQTFSGKVINGIVSKAQKHDIPVVAFCGKLDVSQNELSANGIHRAIALFQTETDFEYIKQHSYSRLVEFTRKFISEYCASFQSKE